MSRAGALSSIGSSPARLAVLRSPVASAHCAAVCSSSLSCSRLVLLAFSCSLPPPALVQKNEPHPARGCACDFCKAKHREPQAERRRKKGRCQQCVPASRDPRGKIGTRAEEADGSTGLGAGKT